jgi:dTDP-4-dehydrorhamnose reductase
VRVLVTGAGGLLGSAVCRTAPPAVEVVGAVRTSPAPDGVPTFPVDLAGPDAVDAMAGRRPDAVIHCAYGMNRADIVGATESVVGACVASGAALVTISTDALFDGEQAPYVESDPPSPITDYGRWKAEAEDIVGTALPDAAIVRTSLLVHSDPPDHGAEWLAATIRRGERVTLFDDELRCPVMAPDLAACLWELVALPPEGRGGVWHVAGPLAMSRAELGRLMIEHYDLDGSKVDVASQASVPGPRPRDVRLSCERALRTLHTRPRPVDAAAMSSPWSSAP